MKFQNFREISPLPSEITKEISFFTAAAAEARVLVAGCGGVEKGGRCCGGESWLGGGGGGGGRGCRRGGRGRGGRDTRLDAATAAGCRRAALVAGYRQEGRGRGVGEGRCRSASVRPGKGCGAEHICCSPQCRFGSSKTSEAAEGASSGGKGWRRRGIRLVVSRPGARCAPAALGSTEEWFLAGSDAYWVEGGLEKLAEGRKL